LKIVVCVVAVGLAGRVIDEAIKAPHEVMNHPYYFQELVEIFILLER
jgi:hypothetical protein